VTVIEYTIAVLSLE